MITNSKKFQAVILTTTLLFSGFQFINTAALAKEAEIDEKVPEIIHLQIDQAQYQETILGVTDKYNMVLKGFSGLFYKKNQEGTSSPKIETVKAGNKIISRNDRKLKVSHRSIAVGITQDGRIQSGRMIWPTTKVSVISGYGARGRSFHHGIDIYNVLGADVFAVTGGIVSYAGWMSGYGNLVEVQHKNGLSTRYAHLSGIIAAVGQNVSPGEVIGKVGSTGRATCTHLHFEVRVNGVSVPPMGYLR
jgi:murein DD-endopeptidase MepM/ murein hydrolase activator NlpD